VGNPTRSGLGWGLGVEQRPRGGGDWQLGIIGRGKGRGHGDGNQAQCRPSLQWGVSTSTR
jgi:hypothetical protein